MTYLAIDPGLDTGWALFADRDSLHACGLGNPRLIPWAPGEVRHVVIEKPKIYQARNMKGDPNDLVTLAIQVGEYKQFFQAQGIPVALVTPHEWKGTMDKRVCNTRTVEELSDTERAVVRKSAHNVPESKQHNILDAIGFGRACFVKRLWR